MLLAKDVRYSYQSKYLQNEVLRGVSCRFDAGTFYAVMGPSGSGKTTLLSLLAGLDLPTAGQILVDGRSTADMNRDVYRLNTASVIYQAFNLLPLLTARENIMLPLRVRGMSRRDARITAEECLSRVRLPQRIGGQRPMAMSGGEQQRVAIARALAMGGKILLADEPTGNLDTENGDGVVALLGQMAHEKGYTVIVNTHSARVAQRADRIYNLEDGVIKGDAL